MRGTSPRMTSIPIGTRVPSRTMLGHRRLPTTTGTNRTASGVKRPHQPSPIHVSNSFAHTTAHPRGGSRPSSAISVPTRTARGRGECRMLAAPMARLQQRTQAAVTTGSAETTGIPRAMVLTLIRDLPGDRLSCPRLRQRAVSTLRRHQHRDARTTRFHVRQADVRLTPPKRPSHPRPTCRDDRAQRPSQRGGMATYNHSFCKKERNLFFVRGSEAVIDLKR